MLFGLSWPDRVTAVEVFQSPKFVENFQRMVYMINGLRVHPFSVSLGAILCNRKVDFQRLGRGPQWCLLMLQSIEAKRSIKSGKWSSLCSSSTAINQLSFQINHRSPLYSPFSAFRLFLSSQCYLPSIHHAFLTRRRQQLAPCQQCPGSPIWQS